MQYLNGKFSVGGVGSAAYDKGYEETFGKRVDPKACTICEGAGRLEFVECNACEGTGRRAHQEACDHAKAHPNNGYDAEPVRRR